MEDEFPPPPPHQHSVFPPSSAANASPPLANGPMTPPPDLRAARIQEHTAQSLQEDDPLLATLGAASGDMLQMQQWLQQALAEAREGTSTALEALAIGLPAVNAHLKVSQQLDRCLRLSLRLREAATNEGGARRREDSAS